MNDNNDGYVMELSVNEYKELLKSQMQLEMIHDAVKSCIKLNYCATDIGFYMSDEMEILLKYLFKEDVREKEEELKPQMKEEEE